MGCTGLGAVLLLARVVAPPAPAAPSWPDVLDHGSVRGFPSYSEANDLLDSWLQAYPHALARKQIGSSYEKRPIYAYILGASGARSASSTPPPAQVLLSSLTHAREPAGLTVLLYFLGQMLEGIAHWDAEATYMLRAREVWLVPFVNPDGYIDNEKLSVKAIRKNRRPTCGNKLDSGVDLNRNYGLHWQKDFSPCNEEFQGEAPFSEPETQAMKRICEENSFAAAMNFHSYGGMLTHPYNWARQPELLADDAQIYSEVGAFFGWPKFGPAIQTVGYTANGESDDWMYGVRHIISMSPEVGPESGDFWPPRSEIAGINTRNFRRTLYVVAKAGLELEVVWTHRLLDAGGTSQQSMAELPGGAPRRMLEMRMGNSGLSASAGGALGVALDGATRAGSGSSVGPGVAALVTSADGQVTKAQLAAVAGSASPALAFALPPLLRRSTQSFLLLLGRDVEALEARTLRVCVAESLPTPKEGAGGTIPGAVCRCGAAARIPEPGPPAEVSADAPQLSFVFADAGAEGQGALCAAAVAALPSPLPPNLRNALLATAGAEPRAAAPTRAGGGAVDVLVVLALAGTILALGACLLVQVLQRHHSSRITARAAGDFERVPALPKVDDVEAIELGRVWPPQAVM